MHHSTVQAPQHSAGHELEMQMGSQDPLVCHHREGLCQGRLPGLGTVPKVSCWRCSDLQIESTLRAIEVIQYSKQLSDGTHWTIHHNLPVILPGCSMYEIIRSSYHTSVVSWLFMISIQPRPRLAASPYRVTKKSSVTTHVTQLSVQSAVGL